MFPASIYQARRRALRDAVGNGLVLLCGALDAPMNAAANHYPFVQDSCFRYFFGLDEPGLTGVIDCDSGDDILFGREIRIEDIIWHGDQPSLRERGAAVGVTASRETAGLQPMIADAVRRNRAVHYTPPYRGETILALAELLNRPPASLNASASQTLIRAIVAQRECKGAEEVAELELALATTARVHGTAMAASRPGAMEYEVVGAMAGIIAAADRRPAYPIIFSRHGEVLHNFRHDGRLQLGDLVINDAGATSPLGYASDITRTLPVGGRFNLVQREFYDLVLAAQSAAIAAMRPGVAFLSIHSLAARVLTEGLICMGILAGDADELVADGVHAILFQSGLGHQIGLDVHDMEALGEQHVGYGGEAKRSAQFGLKHLRMARRLKAGMTMTVEPGLYFIPALIEKWASEQRFAGSIDYGRLRQLVGTGGIRIEDDVLITAAGARVLGPHIPSTAADVEAAMGAAEG